jgi:hypothetical protein
MATKALAILQPVWDCRWSRFGYRLTGVPEAEQPESKWVCVREGARRRVDEAECRTCPHWELNPGTVASATLGTRAAAATVLANEQILMASMRAVLMFTAAIFIATGFVTLTGPLAVPVTVSLWLCAAAFAGLAVFWRRTED